MNTIKKFSIALCASAIMIPAYSQAQGMHSQDFGPKVGDREFTLSGAGTSSKDFDNGTFGVSGDVGWFLSNQTVAGIRQSVNYASVENGDDAWNGSTRGYVDYHFGQHQARPFVGASLGGIYGDGVKNTGVAGLELGLKYYVLPSTFILARAEYQFLFDSGDSAEDNFDNGAWAYVLGMGFNY
ncbi:hypothetical protein [Oceanisphaera sp. KMM 10153]|uniref:hypothetical protein n=1 Tax=Oceanisphaera submarina TaxID=3390193 RepID=UPI00397470D8